MKGIITAFLVLLVFFLASTLEVRAEDKNTSDEYPTAEYKVIHSNGGVSRLVEFIPKGNKDLRCIVYHRSITCYRVGNE